MAARSPALRQNVPEVRLDGLHSLRDEQFALPQLLLDELHCHVELIHVVQVGKVVEVRAWPVQNG